jgi:hypothetical protein
LAEGDGSAGLHLWPSAFSAIKSIILNLRLVDAGALFMQRTTLMVGWIFGLKKYFARQATDFAHSSPPHAKKLIPPV